MHEIVHFSGATNVLFIAFDSPPPPNVIDIKDVPNAEHITVTTTQKVSILHAGVKKE